MVRLILFLALASSAAAGEYAVLATGTRLHADRHEVEGAKVRLFSGAGMTELDASLVARFEQEEYVPAAPAPIAVQAAVPAVPAARPASDPRRLVDEAARKYDLPKAFLHSVVKAESGYRQSAVSPKGCIGLMQLKPSTAKALGADPTDAAQNVDAGARYLSELLLKYDGGVYRALAAYNAGPGAVDKYNGIPPYAETRSYIRRIVESWKKTTD